MSSSDHHEEPERPGHLQEMHHQSNSSFHSRALAVSAANRFGHGLNQSKSPALSASSGPPISPKHRPIPSSIIGATETSPLLSHSPLSPKSGFFSNGPRSPPYEAIASPRGPLSPGGATRRMSGNSTNSMDPVYTWLGGGGGIGDEPGVDVRSKRDEEAWGHLTGKTQVTVVDWTSDPAGKNVRVEFEGDRLKEWLESEHAQRPSPDEGRNRGARWIHVEGVNWQVIKALTLEYGLHPLAVEDALRSHNSPRSKLDFYNSHLYLQILVQHMHAGDETEIENSVNDLNSWHLPGESHLHGSHPIEDEDAPLGRPASQKKRRQSHGLFLRLPEGVQGVFEPTIEAPRGRNQSKAFISASKKSAHRMTVDELSAKYMVPIRRGLISVFLTRDGTLITMSRQAMSEVLHPVYARLEDEASLLRRSGDVSMLAQALLDVSVDLAIEISQTFESEILRLEASVLVDPSIETVRHLHVLSSQLIRLRRSLTPLLHVSYIIRDQDVARSAAASAMTANARPGDRNHISRDSQWMSSTGSESPEHLGHVAPPLSGIPTITNTGPTRPGTPAKSFASLGPSSSQSLLIQNASIGGTQGFFSPMTRVYIGDVLDHLEIIVSNMDQFVATCDHLTDYVFNILSFQTNASTERLSIVTVVFLPLTFIASYFGMNFTDFPSLDNPDAYFWKVAAPCTVGFFVIFSWSYLKLGFETFGRRLGRARISRLVKSREGIKEKSQ